MSTARQDLRHPLALEQALPPAVLLGIAIGCLVCEQMLLALAWHPARGWVALTIAPMAGVLLPLLGLCRALGIPFGAALRLERPPVRRVAAAVLVGCGALFPAHWASRAVSPWLQPNEEILDLYAGLLPTNALAFVGGAVAVAILAPLAEEILFRGLLLRAVARWVAMPVAVLASGLLFGIAHGSLWAAVPVGILGCVLAALAWRSGGVTAPWIAHATFNAAAYVELCATRDVATDVLARAATRPGVAIVLGLMLAVGFGLAAAGTGAAGNTTPEAAPGDDPSAPETHL
jgi:membrane protease YdiL (CAAX protease family)